MRKQYPGQDGARGRSRERKGLTSLADAVQGLASPAPSAWQPSLSRESSAFKRKSPVATPVASHQRLSRGPAVNPPVAWSQVASPVTSREISQQRLSRGPSVNPSVAWSPVATPVASHQRLSRGPAVNPPVAWSQVASPAASREISQQRLSRGLAVNPPVAWSQAASPVSSRGILHRQLSRGPAAIPPLQWSQAGSPVAPREQSHQRLSHSQAVIPPLEWIDSKDGILTFPFDHIYACHTESADGRPELQLDKEVEITTHCQTEEIVETTSPAEFIQLSERLNTAESQNKRLKDLLIYHLDLIQQQNELITKKDKSCLVLKQENDNLKSRLSCMERRYNVTPARQGLNPPPLVHVSSSTIGQSNSKAEADASKILLNSYTELMIPENRTNTYIFDSDLNKPDKYKIKKSSETDTSKFMPSLHELNVLSILDTKNINCQEYKMIESKQPSFNKKEPKSENRQDAMYTMTTGNSANPVIQKIQRSRRKTSGSISSINRAPKPPPVKPEPTENYNFYTDDKSFNRNYTVNKKSKMINTYSKSSRNNFKKTSQFTGSLSDRLKLIDTTPTGEDPYQLGEADMREQSPIPKLTLKTNLGKMKICSSNSNSTITSKRFYSTLSEEPEKPVQKIKLNRYNLTNTYVHPSEIKKEDDSDADDDDLDLDIVKTETDIDWATYTKSGNETSLCDFSYGENANKLAPQIMESVKYQIFSNEPEPKKTHYNSNLKAKEKTVRRPERTTSLMVPNRTNNKTSDASSRKRSLSTTGLLKAIKRDNTPKFGPFMIKPKPIKAKAPAPIARKKSPVPGVETKVPYHTLVGDPDLSWYLGLDPDIKFETVDQAAETSRETVEVPRWREKVYTSCHASEGIENLADKVFEKRHQKLEAEERRQLRWHMRRVREQRHVERLRQRQRDSWYSAAPAAPPTNYTVWPQPLRDVKFIEITETMPVNAFGEELPALPRADFILPWIRNSKALKRATKRARALQLSATTTTTLTATVSSTTTVTATVSATVTATVMTTLPN